MRPQVISNTKPATTGGNTIGRVTIVRTRRGKKLLRAWESQSARGTPKTIHSPVEIRQVFKDNQRASWLSVVASNWGICPQCTRITKAPKGISRKSNANTAGPASQAGDPAACLAPKDLRKGSFSSYLLTAEQRNRNFLGSLAPRQIGQRR